MKLTRLIASLLVVLLVVVLLHPSALPQAVLPGSGGGGAGGSVTQGTIPWADNITQFGGTNVSTGTGAGGAGIPRVTVSNDSNILATQSGAWTVTTTPPANASTNITQFGGVAISTGTGAGGTGIPRVTISNDSSLAANQSVNAAQIGGTNTVSGGVAGSLGVGGLAGSGTSNAGNPVKTGGVFNTTQPTVTNGQAVDDQMTARGAQIVATGVDTFNTTINAALPAGGNTIGAVTQASGPWTNNVTQFGGTNVSTGTGAGGAGIPRVTISNDSSLAANQSVNVSQFGGTNVSTGTGAGGTGIARVTVSNDAVTAGVAGSAVSSLVLKASAGKMYGVYATCTSACWLMVFNATSLPGNGATTAGVGSGNMQDCIAINANQSGAITYSPERPENFSVGITAAISSTNCVTLTASAVAFVKGTAE